MKRVICGLDLSLTGTGICVLSSGAIFCVTTGYVISKIDKKYEEREQIERMYSVAKTVCEIAKRHNVTDVAIEGYAFGKMSGKTNNITKLAELGGFVKSQLFSNCSLVARVVPVKSARALLWPKAGNAKKEDVHRFLRDGGLELSSGDEYDAFVVANWLAKQLGIEVRQTDARQG